MQPDPTWREKMRAARRAALAALSPGEAAQRVADDMAAWAERSARREAKAAQALLVNQRVLLGDTPEEIAARIGITVRNLRHRARRWGHALMQRKGFRRLSVWVSSAHVETLDRLAAAWGVSREKALEELAATALTARAQRRVA